MISKIEWSEGTLSIYFIKSGMYDYLDVPKGVYEEFLSADSIGRYFLHNIEDEYVTIRR